MTMYTKLPERGYIIRIWPARVPANEGDYNGQLAPYILDLIESGQTVGTSTDPDRFREQAFMVQLAVDQACGDGLGDLGHRDGAAFVALGLPQKDDALLGVDVASGQTQQLRLAQPCLNREVKQTVQFRVALGVFQKALDLGVRVEAEPDGAAIRDELFSSEHRAEELVTGETGDVDALYNVFRGTRPRQLCRSQVVVQRHGDQIGQLKGEPQAVVHGRVEHELQGKACLAVGPGTFIQVFVRERINARGISRVIASWKASMGIPKDDEACFHTFRHTCCSRLVQSGVPLMVVQSWMGHAAIQTTLRYAHLAPDSLDIALAALNKRNAA